MGEVDVVVVGAGFGGLAAALRLAEHGANVVLCETLRYPGGCASTFSRRGFRFEAGATLFSGLGPRQLFSTWNDRWGLGLRFDQLDPLVEVRTPHWSLAVPPDREIFRDRVAALPGVDRDNLGRFLRTQNEVADALWPLFQDPSLLPPLDARAVVRHLGRWGTYLPVTRWMGRSLLEVLAQHGLAQCAPLRLYLDAVTQITVQASSADAEAPFAMAAMDYFFRGTGHVHGGIGELAWALSRAIERAGGRVDFANRVRALRSDGRHWHVTTRRGTLLARNVVANVLPQSLASLTDGSSTDDLSAIGDPVEAGWGAAMLYFVVRPEAVPEPAAHHLQLISDAARPLIEGNHVFCSISAADERERAPNGGRTITASTHIPMSKLLGLSPSARGSYVQGVQDTMRQTIRHRAPELVEAPVFEMTASPRTFERFTGRYAGSVGGVPRTVGLRHYRPRALWPRRVARGLFLVGDSVLLGQSTLAVALGGIRTADQIAKIRS